jgi:hypothetical protein
VLMALVAALCLGVLAALRAPRAEQVEAPR